MKPRLQTPRFPLAAKYRDTVESFSPEVPRAALGQLVSAMPWITAVRLVTEFLRVSATDAEIDRVAREAKRRRLPAAAPLFRD
jgi:hypothetical protein